LPENKALVQIYEIETDAICGHRYEDGRSLFQSFLSSQPDVFFRDNLGNFDQD
jgi:hypothetical protein